MRKERRYSVSLLYNKSEQIGSSTTVFNELRVLILAAYSEEEALGKAILALDKEYKNKSYYLAAKVIMQIPEIEG